LKIKLSGILDEFVDENATKSRAFIMVGDVVSINATMYSASGALDGVTSSDASREAEHVINKKAKIITATYRITQLYTDLEDFCEKNSAIILNMHIASLVILQRHLLT
jgi:hypothetical protein